MDFDGSSVQQISWRFFREKKDSEFMVIVPLTGILNALRSGQRCQSFIHGWIFDRDSRGITFTSCQLLVS